MTSRFPVHLYIKVLRYLIRKNNTLILALSSYLPITLLFSWKLLRIVIYIHSSFLLHLPFSHFSLIWLLSKTFQSKVLSLSFQWPLNYKTQEIFFSFYFTRLLYYILHCLLVLYFLNPLLPWFPWHCVLLITFCLSPSWAHLQTSTN